MIHLRQVHQLNFSFDNQSSHPDLVAQLILFLIPYAIMLLVGYLYLTSAISIQALHSIYTKPKEFPQKIIYTLGAIVLGVCAAIAAGKDLWTAKQWILFAIINILIALYLFIYKSGDKFSLAGGALISIALAILSEVFYRASQPNQNSFESRITRNGISYLIAITVILANYNFGQIIVYDFNLSKKCQMIFFWIFTPLILAAVAYWNLSNYAIFDEIGLIVGAVVLLILIAIETKNNYNADIVQKLLN